MGERKRKQSEGKSLLVGMRVYCPGKWPRQTTKLSYPREEPPHPHPRVYSEKHTVCLCSLSSFWKVAPDDICPVAPSDVITDGSGRNGQTNQIYFPWMPGSLDLDLESSGLCFLRSREGVCYRDIQWVSRETELHSSDGTERAASAQGDF